MIPRYQLSEEAQNDLREILSYTQKNWGNHQAKQYLIELTARFEQLADSPKIGRQREEIDQNIRSFQASHHIIFYRTKPVRIEIIRVLHPSMDIDRHFE